MRVWRSVFGLLLGLVLVSSAGAEDMGLIRSAETRLGDIAEQSETETFSFYGEAGQGAILRLFVEDPIQKGYMRLYYGEPPALVADSYKMKLTELVSRLPATGNYTVAINATEGEGNYSLSLLLIPGATTSDEDPDGGEISPDQPESGLISSPADTDAYSFYGHAGEMPIIRMDAPDVTAYAHIRLISNDPPKQVEASIKDDDTAEITDVFLPHTGTYTIVVDGHDGTGAYSLSLAIIPPRCETNADCDDGQYCNGQETCNTESNRCQYGLPVECPPGQSCDEGLDTCVDDCLYTDSDGDGVPDQWDNCSGTPPESCVDENGCSDCCPTIVPVTCDLTPDAISISQGNLFGLDVKVTNNTNAEVRAFYSAEVTERNSGQQIIWASTPASVALDPLEEISNRFERILPYGLSGGFTYSGYVRNKFDEEIHHCEFDFDVILKDNLWNFRGNTQDFPACDDAICNETYVEPWISFATDTSGVFQGECAAEVQWSETFTKSAYMINQVAWVITENGNLTVEAGKDRQWHAWTFVYVDSPKTLTILPGAGSYSSCPQVFLNEQYVVTFDPNADTNLELSAGWNRIDITGYNQNTAQSFDLNFDLVGSVDIMSSRGPE